MVKKKGFELSGLVEERFRYQENVMEGLLTISGLLAGAKSGTYTRECGNNRGEISRRGRAAGGHEIGNTTLLQGEC